MSVSRRYLNPWSKSLSESLSAGSALASSRWINLLSIINHQCTRIPEGKEEGGGVRISKPDLELDIFLAASRLTCVLTSGRRPIMDAVSLCHVCGSADASLSI